MGAFKDIALDIQERIKEGQEPYKIAIALDIPVQWVFELDEIFNEDREDCSPYATINS